MVSPAVAVAVRVYVPAGVVCVAGGGLVEPPPAPPSHLAAKKGERRCQYDQQVNTDRTTPDQKQQWRTKTATNKRK